MKSSGSCYGIWHEKGSWFDTWNQYGVSLLDFDLPRQNKTYAEVKVCTAYTHVGFLSKHWYPDTRIKSKNVSLRKLHQWW